LSEPSHWKHPPAPEATGSIFDRQCPPTIHTQPLQEKWDEYPKHSARFLALFAVRIRKFRLPHGKACLRNYCRSFIAFGLGNESPLAKIYDLDGYVLLLGVDHDKNTSLHLAEVRALPIPGGI